MSDERQRMSLREEQRSPGRRDSTRVETCARDRRAGGPEGEGEEEARGEESFDFP